MLLNEGGFPLSLDDVERQAREGPTFYCRDPESPPPGRQIRIWCVSPEDESWLKRRYPAARLRREP